MTLYKRRPGQPLKWLIGLIVFGLAMGITFADVYGYGGDGTNSVTDGNGPGGGTYGANTNLGTSNEDPSAVPEPTTLILLAGGLSALYAARNRNKKK